MLFSGSRGVKTGRWYPNEILRDEDINFVGFSQYQNITDLLASMVNHGYESGSGAADRVLGGLQLRWNNLLTSDLTAGHALSFTGRYFSSGVWAFAAAAGEIFSVVLPDDVSVAVDAGDGSNPRYDTVEVRPVQTPYNSQSREFKDPITGTVTSAVTSTRTEYGVEFQVKTGTPGADPSAPATTAGWIKIAEVYVATAASDIDQDDIKDVRDSDTWTTDASGTEYSLGLFENLTVSEDLEVTGVLTVDTINESTTDAGVTIEGLLLKDSVLSKTGGNVTIESVVFNGGAISSVTTLAMSGALSGGTTIDISGALTADTINEHTGEAGVTIEGVALEDSAISSVTTLAMSGALSGGTTIDISGALTADTVNEHTGDAGVTIDGILHKDNVISIPGATITFSGADASRTINYASDASAGWDETLGAFVASHITDTKAQFEDFSAPTEAQIFSGINSYFPSHGDVRVPVIGFVKITGTTYHLLWGRRGSATYLYLQGYTEVGGGAAINVRQSGGDTYEACAVTVL